MPVTRSLHLFVLYQVGRKEGLTSLGRPDRAATTKFRTTRGGRLFFAGDRGGQNVLGVIVAGIAHLGVPGCRRINTRCHCIMGRKIRGVPRAIVDHDRSEFACRHLAD